VTLPAARKNASLLAHSKENRILNPNSRDEMIPSDYLLRRINVFATAVLTNLHEQLKAFYGDIGRSSVDPELMIRVLLVKSALTRPRRDGAIDKRRSMVDHGRDVTRQRAVKEAAVGCGPRDLRGPACGPQELRSARWRLRIKMVAVTTPARLTGQ
jgi:hypothetical protein